MDLEIDFPRISKTIKEKVANDLAYAEDIKLRSIVRAYEKLPFYKKFNWPCKQLYWYEKSLRYDTAKAILLGKLKRRDLVNYLEKSNHNL